MVSSGGELTETDSRKKELFMFKYSYKHLSKNIQLFERLIRNANTVQLCFINS